MNFRALLNILGALLTILGLTMIFPIVVSLIFGESDWRAFSVSSAMCIFIGFPSWYITRNNRSLTNRDGFVIVTFSWLCTAIIGTLPFYISGVIPNITDAFFEAMSGVTTTGATIIGNSQTLPNLPNGIESLPHGILFWRSFLVVSA